MKLEWNDPADLTFPERIEQLERHIRATSDVRLDELPMAALQRRLEHGWQPSGSVLLEPKSVSGDQLGTGALVTGEGRMRIICGETTAAGGVARGAGFTNARNGAGDYTVTFTTAFASTPVIVLTTGITIGIFVAKLHQGTPPAPNVFRVSTFNSNTGVATDCIFDFIAIGLA